MEDARLKALTDVTLVGAAVDLVLGVLKVFLGVVENSQALVADGIHSISDLSTDGMMLVAVRQVNKMADEDRIASTQSSNQSKESSDDESVAPTYFSHQQ